MTDVIQDAIEFDGYKLAKELENDGWIPDAGLVDILEGVDSAIHGVVAEKTKLWVADNKITPMFKQGDTVQFYSGWYNRKKPQSGKVEVGEIMKVLADTAEYLIWNESSKAAKGKGGWIIKAERVIGLAPVGEAVKQE